MRASDNYALREASRKGHANVVALLLAVDGIGAEDVRTNNNEALREAQAQRIAAAIRALIKETNV